MNEIPRIDTITWRVIWDLIYYTAGALGHSFDVGGVSHGEFRA